MISLHSIDTTHELWPASMALYLTAFPHDERREPSELLDIFSEKMHQFFVITEEEQFIGIMEIWDFNDFTFLEHLAILPHLQNNGYGSAALDYLTNTVKKTILLEAEIPFDNVSQRRIDFYGKSGFTAIDIDYSQPPYYPKKKSIPMLLLSNSIVSTSEACHYVGIISKKVYKLQ